MGNGDHFGWEGGKDVAHVVVSGLDYWGRYARCPLLVTLAGECAPLLVWIAMNPLSHPKRHGHPSHHTEEGESCTLAVQMESGRGADAGYGPKPTMPLWAWLPSAPLRVEASCLDSSKSGQYSRPGSRAVLETLGRTSES